MLLPGAFGSRGDFNVSRMEVWCFGTGPLLTDGSNVLHVQLYVSVGCANFDMVYACLGL